jgi:ketosteroid isomerase-like protein
METNLETYSRLVGAFNEEGPDAVLEFFAEDVEIYDPDLPGDGIVRGREQVREVMQLMLSGTEASHVREFEVIPSGDRVVALTHTYLRGEGGAPEVEVRDAHTMTFRDGKVVYWRLYVDRNEALADAGLDPIDPNAPRPGPLDESGGRPAAT